MSEKIIFLGLLFDNDEEQKLLKKSKIGLQGAINAFQWAAISGIEKKLKKTVDIISTLPVGTFPRQYSSLVLKSCKKEREGAVYSQIGTINLPILKQLGRRKKLYALLDKMLKSDSQINLKIIVYSIYSPYILALCRLKYKYGERIKVCPIITDLPMQYGIMPKGKLKRFLYNLRREDKNLERVKRFDGFVLLTEEMKNPLEIESNPYIVVEGIADTEIFSNIIKSESEKSILYTGTLNRVFGIGKLLEAFEMIEGDEYRLDICGDGDMREEIKDLCEKDKRIRYHGYLPREEILMLQASSMVLVNPRENEGEYTKYSFPSKTMEYLMSATPIVMYDLPGVPREYYDHIVVPQDNSAAALKDCLVAVCELDKAKRMSIGYAGKRFITEEKSAEVQAEKILKLIDRL